MKLPLNIFPEKTVKIKEEVKIEEKPSVPVEEPSVPVEESSTPKTVSVTIPTETSSPGCETSNACYLPASSTINVGDTVEWKNTDTAAHDYFCMVHPWMVGNVQVN